MKVNVLWLVFKKPNALLLILDPSEVFALKDLIILHPHLLWVPLEEF